MNQSFLSLFRLAVIVLCACFGAPKSTVAEPRVPARFALLVGVDKNINSAYDLKGPGNDVGLMKALLVEVYGFPPDPEHILTLVGAQATKAAIAAAFKTHLIDNAQKYPGARFFFYFSGHGAQAPDAAEGDGLDETLVAYDSRSPPNGEDILDKELSQWIGQLRQHSRNLAVMLDSCNSGDATRDVSDPPVFSRGLPRNPNRSHVASSLDRGVDGGREERRQESENNDYAAIAAAAPGELANEGMINERGQYHGFLTYYVEQALRRNPGLTYEQAVRFAEPAIRKRSSQHPQAEGNVRVPFLGSAEDEQSAYVRITGVPETRRVAVAAGELHGLTEGSFVAVYAAKTQRLIGEEGKLADGRVSTASMRSAVVELLDAPQRPVTVDDKVSIVTPFWGGKRLSVFLTGLPGQAMSDRDEKVLAATARALSDSSLVASTPAAESALVIQRGCVDGAGQLIPSGRVLPGSPACDPVYYVASRENRNRALAEMLVSKADPIEAGGALAGYLSARAFQENLRVWDNARSPLKGQLRVWLEQVRTVPANRPGARTLVIEELGRLVARPVPRIRIGQEFAVKAQNLSDRPLFVAVMMLGTSGTNRLQSFSPQGEQILPGKTVRLTPALRAGRPLGLETYKVIATTQPGVDFQVLEGQGRKNTAESSPFEVMMRSLRDANSRDGIPLEVRRLNLDDWVSERADVELIP